MKFVYHLSVVALFESFAFAVPTFFSLSISLKDEDVTKHYDGGDNPSKNSYLDKYYIVQPKYPGKSACTGHADWFCGSESKLTSIGSLKYALRSLVSKPSALDMLSP